MTKSLIINPPFLEPHRPPIACAILAEILRLEKHEITTYDLNIALYHKLGIDNFHDLQIKVTTAGDTTFKDILIKLLQTELKNTDVNKFDWIIISCFSFWNITTTREICKWLKQHTSAKIIVGGPGIEVNNIGQEFYQQGLVDFYIYGEGEYALANLVQGNILYPGINGIPPRQIESIENLPLPNYGYFDLKKYNWLLDAPDVFIYGSRGCVRKCTFCDVEHYWPKFRWRSGQSIANEMISNYEHYGVKNFFFCDSLVNGNQKEFKIMCEILAKYHEDLFRWGSYAIVRPKSEHSAGMFDLIKAAGGRHWSIGIETGVDRIRFEMQKKFTNNDIDWHLEQSQRVGLRNLFLNIPTWPSETLEEHNEYVNMFSRWRPYAVDGTIFGINISTTLSILNNTRLHAQQGSIFNFDDLHDSSSIELQSLTWYSESNPLLTHQENFRRTLALYKAAIENNWPLTNRLQQLHQLKATLTAWTNNTILPKSIIPIKAI